MMMSSMEGIFFLGGGIGGTDLAVQLLGSEDDDNRSRNGEESQVQGFDCDGSGHRAVNEDLNDDRMKEHNGDGMTEGELVEEGNNQIEVMTDEGTGAIGDTQVGDDYKEYSEDGDVADAEEDREMRYVILELARPQLRQTR